MNDFDKKKRAKTKSIYISTIFSIALVLLMLGLLSLLLLNARALGKHVKEGIVLNVFVAETADSAHIQQLGEEIKGNASVKDVKYISKAEAAKSLSQELGEDFEGFLKYNPLLPVYDVHMKEDFANEESISKLKAQLLGNTLVNDVVYQNTSIDKLNRNIRSISLILLAFSAILTVIAIALINNTIRLEMFSQRFIIKSMQLVGATNSYIRRPFTAWAALHGLIAAIIAIGLLILCIWAAERQLPELRDLRNNYNYGLVMLGMTAAGIFISLVCTFFAVNKYLRRRINTLYR